MTSAWRHHRGHAGAVACWLAGLVVLAGCARQPVPQPTPPAPKPASSARVDGIYRGTSTRYQADARACPSPGLVVLRVVDGTFQYRWNGRTEIDATIAPDGAVQGTFGDISLNGRFAQDRIEGDVQNISCAYHFRATKRAR